MCVIESMQFANGLSSWQGWGIYVWVPQGPLLPTFPLCPLVGPVSRTPAPYNYNK
jgi:hypothetical protein